MQGRLIRARLLENGLTLREFARKHGFKYETVQKVIARYSGKPDATPRGAITREIISTFQQYTHP